VSINLYERANDRQTSSPFLKKVNQASAVRLHELIITFSTEEFLLKEEHNYLILAKVLGIIENLLVYQYDVSKMSSI
jgi:hypothetical protein